jgi:hypothetical protein
MPSKDRPVERFKDDERGYQRWLRTHPRGFVFNHFGGSSPDDDLMHTSRCDHLYRYEDHGRRTRVEKVCSDDLRELEAWADAERGRSGWRRCETCGPR